MSNKLFELSDLNSSSEDSVNAQFSEVKNSKTYFAFNCQASKLLEKLAGNLPENAFVEFVTAGEFSLHNLIAHILNISGPSEIYLSTWAIKEEPCRALDSLIKNGLIKALHAVVDKRTMSADAKYFGYFKNLCASIALSENHSKVVAIQSEAMSFTIVCSANLSVNTRNEAGIIQRSVDSYNFHKTWMLKVLNGQKAY